MVKVFDVINDRFRRSLHRRKLFKFSRNDSKGKGIPDYSERGITRFANARTIIPEPFEDAGKELATTRSPGPLWTTTRNKL